MREFVKVSDKFCISLDREREVINTEVICKGRGQGKTYDLVMESARTGYPIITPYESRYIVDMAKSMGIDRIPQPMSLKEFNLFKNNGSLVNSPSWKGKVLVDEFDTVLERLLGVNVGTVTCTPDSLDYRREYMGEWIGGRDMHPDAMDSLVGQTLYFKNGSYIATITGNICEIKDVNIIVPNKVVEVTFADKVTLTKF